MSSEILNTDWRAPASLKTAAARRFAEFYQHYFAERQQDVDGVGFDADLYQEAARLVLSRLDRSAKPASASSSVNGDQS